MHQDDERKKDGNFFEVHWLDDDGDEIILSRGQQQAINKKAVYLHG